MTKLFTSTVFVLLLTACQATTELYERNAASHRANASVKKMGGDISCAYLGGTIDQAGQCVVPAKAPKTSFTCRKSGILYYCN